MDARPWQSSANRYYAFGGEKLGLLHRISKTPPPPSTRSSHFSRCTYDRRSAPTSPMFGSSALPSRACWIEYHPRGIHPCQDPRGTCPHHRLCSAIIWTLTWTRRRKSKSYGYWIITGNWFIRGILGRTSIRIVMKNSTSLET
jgi:hypothetical protein